MPMDTSDSLSAPVRDGLATLGPELVHLRATLERKFLGWAVEQGAEPMLFPPLIRVTDLEQFDYFRNFPHLPLLVAGLRPECLHETAEHGIAEQAVSGSDLTAAAYALPSAACYNIYLHLSGAVVGAPRYITTVASCFRNEQRYDDLRRLWGFTMREIVCVGTRDEVQDHLRHFKQQVSRFGEELGLGLAIEIGEDPFYQPKGARSLMQQLFPQKEEFVYDGSLAIASLNFHRNFFGERCKISTAGGKPAFTGCVAFGLERWLHALRDHFEGNVTAAAAAVNGAG